MTDYFKCIACGAIVQAEYGEWPTCKCRDDRMYSHQLIDDFDTATEDDYYEYIAEQQD